jgi:hypothetical protein
MSRVIWQTRQVMLEGLDAKSDPKSVLDGKLLSLENAVWARPGALNKRADLHTQWNLTDVISAVLAQAYRYGPLPDVTALAAANSITKFRNKPVLLDGSRLLATGTGTLWTEHGPQVPVGVKSEKALVPPLFASSTSTGAHVDSCFLQDIVVVASFAQSPAVATEAQLVVSIFNYPSMTLVRQKVITIATLFAGVRCVQVGTDNIWVLYGNAGTIEGYNVDVTMPESDLGTTTILATLKVAGQERALIDAVKATTGAYAFVGYINASDEFHIAKITAAGAVSVDVNVDSGAAYTPCVTCTAANEVFGFWVKTIATNRGWGVAYDGNLSGTVFAAKEIIAAASGSGIYGISAVEIPGVANSVLVAYSSASTFANVRFGNAMAIVTNAGTIVSTSTSSSFQGPLITSRFVVRGSNILFVGQYTKGSTYTPSDVWTPTSFLMAFKCTNSLSFANASLSILARFLESQTYDFESDVPVRANLLSVEANKLMLHQAGLFAAGGVRDVGDDFSTPVVAQITFDFSARPRCVEFGSALFVCGGYLQEFDGRQHGEAGLHLGPDTPSITQLAGSGTFADGQYQITSLFAWRSSNGRLYKSSPALVTTVTVAAGGGVARLGYEVRPIPWSCFRPDGEITLVVYCSALNGSVLHEVGSTVIVAGAYPQVVITDPPTGDEPLLYTTGGILPHFAPPAAWNVIERGNRLFAACNDGHVHFTKELVDGESAAQFCDEFVKVRPGADSEPFYVAEMDGNVFAFHKKGIAVFGGPGPNDLGFGNFTDFQEIAVDVPGITDYTKAVPVKSDSGLLFWTNRGPMMLNRQLQVEPIGLPIETAVSGLTCLDILNLPVRYQAWFLTASKVFVFDYLLKRWSTFPLSYTAVGMVEIDNAVYIAGSDGKVYKELTNTFKSTDVMKFRTGWIRPENYLGEFRVRKMALLGTKKSAATITVKVYFDYSDTAAETHTLAIGTPWTSEPGELVVPLDRQRCQAVSFEVYDGSLSGTNEGITVSGMTLEIGMMADRIVKVPAAKITS